MKTYNKLSFVVPCYNCEGTVEESLKSIYTQDLDLPFEVVCTDDGSTDKTLSILLNYERTHPNFKVARHSKNLGEAYSANTAVKNSSGDLIFRLDADNVLAMDSVQGLVEHIRVTGAGACSFSTIQYFMEMGKPLHKWVYEQTNGYCDLVNVISSAVVPPSSGNYLYTRESYNKAGGYPLGHGMASWGFGFRQVATGTNIAILPDSYYWHRLSPNSEWHRGEKRNTNSLDCNNFVRDFLELFSMESQEWILSDDSKYRFFAGLESGKLTLK